MADRLTDPLLAGHWLALAGPGRWLARPLSPGRGDRASCGLQMNAERLTGPDMSLLEYGSLAGST
jgi:hypothetical protein